MTENDQKTNDNAVAKLDKEIVKVPMSKEVQAIPKTQVNRSKLLSLAKRIRESYDYNDVTFSGIPHPPRG